LASSNREIYEAPIVFQEPATHRKTIFFHLTGLISMLDKICHLVLVFDRGDDFRGWQEETFDAVGGGRGGAQRYKYDDRPSRWAVKTGLE
jgi:hypothetical protein